MRFSFPNTMGVLCLLVAALCAPDQVLVAAAADADSEALVALDTAYQRAVQDNDVRTMARILDDRFVLVEGDGKRSSKADLLRDAQSGRTHYSRQTDSDRTVLVWGNTAVVTARLWAQGIEDGVGVDYQLWFSDTYVRTASGWSYVFGQASLPLPKKHRH